MKLVHLLDDRMNEVLVNRRLDAVILFDDVGDVISQHFPATGLKLAGIYKDIYYVMLNGSIVGLVSKVNEVREIW